MSNQDILRKLFKIAQNQQKLICKLASKYDPAIHGEWKDFKEGPDGEAELVDTMAHLKVSPEVRSKVKEEVKRFSNLLDLEITQGSRPVLELITKKISEFENEIRTLGFDLEFPQKNTK